MPAKPVEHTWPVEYRKPSSSGNSPWKRCKAPCRLTVTVETGRRLRYEIYSNEKTYEEGWLNDSRLDVGNAGLTEDLQRTTIRIVTCPKDNTPTSSFCGARSCSRRRRCPVEHSSRGVLLAVTFNATAERDRAMTLLWPSCRGGAQTAPSNKKRPQHSIGKTPKRACPSTVCSHPSQAP
jgi:hypothetical protein